MKTTKEVSSSDWPAFCSQLTQQRVGAVVKMEIMAADGRKTESADNATFQSMVFVKGDGCSDFITLRLRTEREIVHNIVEPIELTLHASGATGDFNPLEIKAESGLVKMVFHPAIHKQLLEELKAG